ncbi:hypothetical protein ACXR0O_00485 [Verrucomicrobiota bacterium sgz303538]
MRSSAIFQHIWRTVLVLQFLGLAALGWQTSRMIGYQVRNGGHFPLGCTSITIGSSLAELAVEALALVSILGLLARRRWARYLYVLFWCVLMLILIDYLRSSPIALDVPDIALLTVLATTSFVAIASFSNERRLFLNSSGA